MEGHTRLTHYTPEWKLPQMPSAQNESTVVWSQHGGRPHISHNSMNESRRRRLPAVRCYWFEVPHQATLVCSQKYSSDPRWGAVPEKQSGWGPWGELGMCCFLKWVSVTQICSFYENSLSCPLTTCDFPVCIIHFNKKFRKVKHLKENS